MNAILINHQLAIAAALYNITIASAPTHKAFAEKRLQEELDKACKFFATIYSVWCVEESG